jgi:hypothetical protein
VRCCRGWYQCTKSTSLDLCCCNLQLPPYNLHTLVTCTLLQGDWEAAQRLFSSMMGPNPLCRPNAVTFSVMMAAHLQHGSPGAIKQVCA